MVALGDARDGARDPDAVRAHDHGAQLAVLVEHLEVERLGVLGAELEDVPHLDAAGRLQAVPARGAGVAVAHLRGLDGAVGGEVAPGDEVDDVPARLVGTGHPRRALADPRVEQVADAGRLVGTEHAGPDVALGQGRVRPRSPSRRTPRRWPARPARRAASRRPRGRRAGRWPAAHGCRRGARARRARSSACPRPPRPARPSGGRPTRGAPRACRSWGCSGCPRRARRARPTRPRHPAREPARPRRWPRSRSWCTARRCPRRSRRSRGTPPTSSRPSHRPSPGRSRSGSRAGRRCARRRRGAAGSSCRDRPRRCRTSSCPSSRTRARAAGRPAAWPRRGT